jgi:hypothetical protein
LLADRLSYLAVSFRRVVFVQVRLATNNAQLISLPKLELQIGRKN